MGTPVYTSTAELLSRYDGLLLDAYGVLVSSGGALPGAVAFIDRLLQTAYPFLIVSNDASRTLPELCAFYRRCGLDIPQNSILTSGMLLAPFMRTQGLMGCRALVLGPEGSRRLVRDAGATLVEPEAEFELLVVADEAGYPLLETLDETVTRLFHLVEAGRTPALLLPNPDMLYPRGASSFGFAAGSVALLLEQALRRRFPGRDLGFTRLGKPASPLFAEAQRCMAARRLAMIGDQLETDVRGAKAVGMDTVLIETGIDRYTDKSAVTPDWLLASLTE
ncbi:MAG: HAD-IIA family hydrolase [Myxococcota bacterium]